MSGNKLSNVKYLIFLNGNKIKQNKKILKKRFFCGFPNQTFRKN